MIAVAVALVALEARQEDDGRLMRMMRTTSRSTVSVPTCRSFLEPLREAVVDDGGEVLLVDAVVAIGDEQFLGANQAEPVEQLRTDGVVARLAAVERQQRQPRAVAAAQPREHAAMLVVGMRGGVHHAGGGAQLQELLPRLCRAVLRRNG